MHKIQNTLQKMQFFMHGWNLCFLRVWDLFCSFFSKIFHHYIIFYFFRKYLQNKIFENFFKFFLKKSIFQSGTHFLKKSSESLFKRFLNFQWPKIDNRMDTFDAGCLRRKRCSALSEAETGQLSQSLYPMRKATNTFTFESRMILNAIE